MIVVSVGTNEARFDRLLIALQSVDLDEELVVQYGSCSVRPSSATLHEFVTYQELVELMRSARAVVAHAGVGIVLTALANGKRPIVMPRLKRFGEAVDDHQLHFGRRLEARGLVTVVEDTPSLQAALADDSSCRVLEITPDPSLIDELRSQIIGAVGSRTDTGGATLAA